MNTTNENRVQIHMEAGHTKEDAESIVRLEKAAHESQDMDEYVGIIDEIMLLKRTRKETRRVKLSGGVMLSESAYSQDFE